jgi:hypothetical protein
MLLRLIILIFLILTYSQIKEINIKLSQRQAKYESDEREYAIDRSPVGILLQ